jgi:hypothetical protein
MAKLTVTIPDELARLVKDRQRRSGLATTDDAALALISEGLRAERLGEDHSGGLSDDELRALLDEAERSGPAEAWDPKAVRSEVQRRASTRPKN